ncbi:MAG: hypothetical protein ACI8P3_000186 [Saprospiraceae bacterium]|jgi:hypothetical protein
MNTLKNWSISFLSMLFVLSACTSETANGDKSPTLDQLKGRWDLTSALRDGGKTSSLEGTFMNFSDKKMTCNFIGEEVNSSFTFENNQLTQGDQTYEIVNFTPAEMVVATTLMDFDFKLTFTKATE